MLKLGFFLAALAVALPGAVVLDRVAVVVNKHAIKLSDIQHELRLTEFINSQPLDLGTAARKQAADHLIDQAVIRDEIALEGYGRATDTQATSMLNQFRKNRFAGSDARLRASLERYGLTENELHDHLLWQMTVLDFIDQRFRPGVMVNDNDVRRYYDSHLDQLKKQHPRDFSFEKLAPEIRTLLEGEQVNKQFDAWLDESRKNARIQYLNGAFQ